MEAMNRVMTLAAKWSEWQAGRLPQKPDFLVCKIAGGILLPRVARQLQGTNSCVASANGLEGTISATPLERPGPLPEGCEHRIVSCPERGECLLLHGANRVIGPVGVWVYEALGIDVGHSDAG